MSHCLRCRSSFELFCEPVAFCSNRSQVLDDLEWLYGPFLTDVLPTSLIAVIQSEANTRVVTPSGSRDFGTYWGALLFGIKARLIDLFWQPDARPVLFHGAAACRDGTAILIMGPDGSGKTTMALTLKDHGFEIYSDEFGVFDPRESVVWPYPAPIAVHPQSLPSLSRDLEFRPHLFEKNIWTTDPTGGKKYLLPLPISCEPEPCPLVTIVLLGSKEAQEVDLRPLEPGEFVELLLSHPNDSGRYYVHQELGGNATTPTILGMADILQQVAIFRVTRNPPHDIARVLAQMHRGRSG